MSDWKIVGNPALVLVHMQNAICKAPSRSSRSGIAGATWEDGIVPNIQSFRKPSARRAYP